MDLRPAHQRTLPLKKNPLDARDGWLRSSWLSYRGQMGQRKETEAFRRFEVDDLLARDKLNLDIFWLKDDSLDDVDSLGART